MFDIIHSNKPVVSRAARLGIKPLVIGEDVILVGSVKERKTAAATIVLATTVERDVIKGPVDGVVDIEDAPKKDHLHFRRGGLTQVEAKILAEQQKAYVVDYSAVRTAKDPAVRIGRIVANIRICEKFGVPVIFASFAESEKDFPAPSDLEAFWRSMGASDQVTRQSQKEFSAWVSRARHRASSAYIAEGVSKAR